MYEVDDADYYEYNQEEESNLKHLIMCETKKLFELLGKLDIFGKSMRIL